MNPLKTQIDTTQYKTFIFQINLYLQYNHYQTSTEIFMKIDKLILECTCKIKGQ